MKAFVALAALLFAIGLATSRLGLLLHELGGHWGVAASFGCRLTELRLFVFGGGYVNFECAQLTAAQSLAIDLGGIALQFGVGALLLLVARGRHGLAGLAATCIGWLFVVHAGFYLVTGVHYGVGDGRQLHQLLAQQRGAAVAVGGALLVAACGVFAWILARRLSLRLATASWAGKVATLAGAVLVATAAHGALTWTEQRIRADVAYATAFEPEHERQIDAALRRIETHDPRRSPAARYAGSTEQARTPQEVAVARRAIEAEHAVFPLTPVLAIAMAGAAIAGIAVALRPR